MNKSTINTNNCTPEQQYLIHRARSARWEIERDRQKLPLRKSSWQATAEAVLTSLGWLAILVVCWALIARLPV